VDIVLDLPGVVCATQGHIFFTWWRQSPALPEAADVMVQFEKFAKATPGGLIFFVLTGSDVGPPERGASDLMGKTTRALEKAILANAFVLEGSGFKAGALRTSIRAVQTMTRVIFPWTIAATVEDGAFWLARKAKFLSEEQARSFIEDVKALRATRATRV
jgi:hypothetical protein